MHRCRNIQHLSLQECCWLAIGNAVSINTLVATGTICSNQRISAMFVVTDPPIAKASPWARLAAARRAAAGHAALMCVPRSEFDIELTSVPGPRKRAREKDTARVTDSWGSWAA